MSQALPSRPPRAPGATDRVAAELREAIAALEFAPGALLDKASLARRFGVSRFPIAEAFHRLKAEGLVDIRPQSGTRVSLIRLADARENLFLRRALEGEAAAWLAGRGAAALMPDLQRNLSAQKAAFEIGDRLGFHRLDLDFHDILVSGVGYPRLRASVEQARLALDRVRRLLSSPRRHQVTFDEHAAIVAALGSGDAVAARAAMARHIDSVTGELESFAAAHPQAFADLS